MLTTRQLLLASWLVAQCSLLAFADPAPADSVRRYQTGLAYERLGRLEEAYTELQLACALEADNARMALALGVVAARLGRDEVALRALEHSIALDANSAGSYYAAAFLYEKLHATERALDSWNRFLQINPDELLKIQARRHIHYLESPKS